MSTKQPESLSIPSMNSRNNSGVDATALMFLVALKMHQDRDGIHSDDLNTEGVARP
jgi:hypothetical protein